MYPSDFARELEVKCSRGQVRITADSQVKKSQVRYREMTCFFFFFFFFFPSFCNVHACASAASASAARILYEAGYHGDAVLQRLSKR